jgi:hypothetical protein
MKATEELKQWLSKHNLSIYDLLSIAFVPRRTYDDIKKGSRLLPALYRLYSATELPEFALSEKEKVLYGNSKEGNKESKANMDEFISKKFIDEFKQGTLPSFEDRLVHSESKYQDKKILTGKLIKKFSGGVKKDPVKEISTQVNGTFIPTGILLIASSEIESAIKAPEDSVLQQYIRTNAKFLKRLSMYINVLSQPDPKTSLKKIEETQQNFS